MRPERKVRVRRHARPVAGGPWGWLRRLLPHATPRRPDMPIVIAPF